MTRDEALALVATVRRFMSRPVGHVGLLHHCTAVTRIVNNRQVFCDDEDRLLLRFDTQIGDCHPVELGTSVRDLDTLQRAIHAIRMAPMPAPNSVPQEDADSSEAKVFWGAKPYLPVTLWHDSTVHAIDDARGATLERMLTQVRDTPFMTAATVALSAQAQLQWYGLGRCAWGEATDSEITMTARTVDGKASGWSGQTHRDWTKLDPDRVVREALTMAEQSRNPVRVEPGRYTAILGPAAVGQLVAEMLGLWDADRTDSGGTPFSQLNALDGHRSKLYQRVMDSRLTIETNPADPDGGDYPFFIQDGFPSGATTLVKDGVLHELAYHIGYAFQRGKTPRKPPFAIRMSGGTTPIADMIANCERGIYVNRLSSIQIQDYPSGAMTGVTRDGCFLIQNGKLAHPATNFRFYESPVIVFNKILALGVPQRVAFGTHSGIHAEYDGWAITQWPLGPVIVPPVMVRDFNFSALSDAV